MDFLSGLLGDAAVADIQRLGIAVILGALVGLEREIRRKPAGLKTHAMVALGAAAFTLVTFHIVNLSQGNPELIRSDPLRVVSGVIGGIGFLGAGAILQSRGNVRGITTAANIWVVGAIGVACGAGAYRIAILTTLFVYGAMFLLHQVEQRFLHVDERE